jgi:predicted transcriptional regulator
VVNFADGMRSDHARGVSAVGPVDLSVQLSHVLLALTLDYESGSQLSLPLVADVLVHLGERDMPVTELVAASGVSKVAINALLGFLQRRGLGVVSSQERRRFVRLTSTGMEAREQHLYTLDGQPKRHRERYGAAVDELSAAALAILEAREADDTPRLAEGLRSLPGSWRAWPRYRVQTEAFVADPWRLPAQPMVLHRGGYPDGS